MLTESAASETAPPRSILVHADAFSGELADLLTGVRQERIDVLQVRLAPIADSILAAAQAAPTDLALVGESLNVCTQLMALKAATLVPSIDDPVAEPVEENDRAIQHDTATAAEARQLASLLAASLAHGTESFARSDYVEQRHTVEPEPLPRALLASTMAAQLKRYAARQAARVAAPRFLHIDVALASLRHALGSLGRLSFGRFVREYHLDRAATVVHFLAILDLVRRREAEVQQTRPFGDIVVHVTDAQAQEAS